VPVGGSRFIDPTAYLNQPYLSAKNKAPRFFGASRSLVKYYAEFRNTLLCDEIIEVQSRRNQIMHKAEVATKDEAEHAIAVMHAAICEMFVQLALCPKIWSRVINQFAGAFQIQHELMLVWSPSSQVHPKIGNVDGNKFTMDNEGMVLVYQK
jgi:hypothetical protein